MTLGDFRQNKIGIKHKIEKWRLLAFGTWLHADKIATFLSLCIDKDFPASVSEGFKTVNK